MWFFEFISHHKHACSSSIVGVFSTTMGSSTGCVWSLGWNTWNNYRRYIFYHCFISQGVTIELEWHRTWGWPTLCAILRGHIFPSRYTYTNFPYIEFPTESYCEYHHLSGGYIYITLNHVEPHASSSGMSTECSFWVVHRASHEHEETIIYLQVGKEEQFWIF